MSLFYAKSSKVIFFFSKKLQYTKKRKEEKKKKRRKSEKKKRRRKKERRKEKEEKRKVKRRRKIWKNLSLPCKYHLYLVKYHFPLLSFHSISTMCISILPLHTISTNSIYPFLPSSSTSFGRIIKHQWYFFFNIISNLFTCYVLLTKSFL